MVKGNLVMHANTGNRKGQTVSIKTHRVDGKWYVTKTTMRSIFVHEVTEYDIIGLAWLMEHEVNPQEGA